MFRARPCCKLNTYELGGIFFSIFDEPNTPKQISTGSLFLDYQYEYLYSNYFES